MSIDGLGSLANQALQTAATSSPNSRVGQAAKAATTSAAAHDAGPAAVYHGLEGANPSTLKVFSWDPKIEQNRQMQMESAELWLQGVPKASATLEAAYESASATLSPELKNKDWGFSVSSGSLVILKGHDVLSNDDMSALKQALAGVTGAANALASVTTRMLESNRGTYGMSNGIGRFDVSKENFSSIVNLRDYLRAQGPNGQYAKTPTNPTDRQSAFAFGGYALMNQIEQRAAARFTIPKYT